MQTKELTIEEMTQVNGGGLLSGRDSVLSIGIELGIRISHTDDEGNTESRELRIGLGNRTSSED